MEVQEAIRTKRAVRKFTDQPVPEETIRHIIDLARRSQSSKNTQPWHYIVIRDRAKLQELTEAGNFTSHLPGAAFAVALIADRQDGSNMFDLGQTAAYLQLAAWELGIGSCIATFHSPEKSKEILGIPEDKFAPYAISFGYPAEAPHTPRKGGRKPLDEVVKWEAW